MLQALWVVFRQASVNCHTVRKRGLYKDILNTAYLGSRAVHGVWY